MGPVTTNRKNALTREKLSVGTDSRSVSSGPSRMFFALTEGRHVGYSWEFVGTVYCILSGHIRSNRPCVWWTVWWRHQMEIFSALRALCDGNPPVTGGFPSQRPVTRSFGVFFDLRLNKLLRKQSRRRWFETPSPSLWRHCHVTHATLAPINCTGTQSHALSKSLDLEVACWALFQYPIRHLMTRSHKVSKQWDFYLELSSGSEIWQTPRQHCCRCVCQISKRCEHFKPRPRAFETTRVYLTCPILPIICE